MDYHFRGVRLGDLPRNNFISSVARVLMDDPYEANKPQYITRDTDHTTPHHTTQQAARNTNQSKQRKSGEKVKGKVEIKTCEMDEITKIV